MQPNGADRHDVSWAQLDLLTSLPAVDLSAAPQVQVIFPQGRSVSGLIDVQGSVPGGVIPTYVRLLFYPRRNQILGATASNGAGITLSAYSIDPNNITVLTRSLPGRAHKTPRARAGEDQLKCSALGGHAFSHEQAPGPKTPEHYRITS
jgi:hypothetical protein